jgi:hypothetical protein
MDGMAFIGRDWHDKASQGRRGSTVRYAMASLAVYVTVVAVTLIIIALLDQGGIHLPVCDDNSCMLGAFG